MTFFECLPIMLLSINCIGLSYWISKLSSRISDLERALKLKEWIEAISNGESPSDLAYMQERGFLK
jgi:hypothetical protein